MGSLEVFDTWHLQGGLVIRLTMLSVPPYLYLHHMRTGVFQTAMYASNSGPAQSHLRLLMIENTLFLNGMQRL